MHLVRGGSPPRPSCSTPRSCAVALTTSRNNKISPLIHIEQYTQCLRTSQRILPFQPPSQSPRACGRFYSGCGTKGVASMILPRRCVSSKAEAPDVAKVKQNKKD